MRTLEFSGVLFKSLWETRTDFALNFPAMEILLDGPNSINYFYHFFFSLKNFNGSEVCAMHEGIGQALGW